MSKPVPRLRRTRGSFSGSLRVFEEEEMNEQIRDVILARSERLSAGDVAGMQQHNAPSMVAYTLAPPLAGDPDGRDPKRLEAWLQGFEAPPRRQVTSLEITADGDVAFAT